MQARLLISATLLALVAAAAPHAQQAAAPEPSQLPVRRVVLYKSGVGYFEHQGSVTGSTEVAVQFTSGQLDDVLKSLTALDLDDGRIASIGYNSIAPLEQRLDALRLPLGSQPDLLQFYNALRGARVEVRSGSSSVTGRLLGIERKPARDTTSEPTDVLTVVSNDGTVRTIVLRPTVSVRIAEQDLREDVSRYLAVVASGRDQDIRRMRLTATGNGTRRLLVSYISEVPIWKSTYRLVLPPNQGDPAVLQGWAVVDNTVGADWTNVELSLVAGAPQSFIQRVSQPYYARRPEVPLPAAVLLNPQTHQATLQGGQGVVRGIVRDGAGTVLPGVTVVLRDRDRGVIGQTVTGSGGEYSIEAAPGSYQLVMTLEGFSITGRDVTLGTGAVNINGTMRVGGVSEAITVTGETPLVDVQSARQSVIGGGGGRGGGFAAGQAAPAPPARPAQEAFARLAGTAAAAEGQGLGDLFEYRLTQPVTIRTNQSALVPILNGRVAAERVSIWNRAPGNGRPLRAIWLTNATGLTLDGGTLTVIDANAFAGEGLIEPLKPSEKRLISYGSDLAVMVDARLDESSGRYTRVIARDGVVIAEEENLQRWVYRIRNEDAAARTLVVEHPVRPGWTLTGDPAPSETTATAARYRVPVAARAEGSLRVTERNVGETRFSIDRVDERLIATFGQRGVSVDELRRVLQPVMDARARLAALERQHNELSTQVATIGTDQERVRENIKALGSSRQERALVERYTRELTAQENRLQELRAELAKAAAAREMLRTELSALMQKLTFEVTVR